jgi:hypothetical protein
MDCMLVLPVDGQGRVRGLIPGQPPTPRRRFTLAGFFILGKAIDYFGKSYRFADIVRTCKIEMGKTPRYIRKLLMFFDHFCTQARRHEAHCHSD